ncbi:MAG: transglycosylase domain-containing protein [Bacteroidales bacterium]|nr:transglycosylase domain-containing protein [Bacteroidales bacterium]
MKSIIIISLFSLVIFLILLGNLIKDTVRLTCKHIKETFSNHRTVFYAELCVSVIIIVVAALCAGAAELAVSAIFAEIFSNDITQFGIMLRGVFSLYSETQNPANHILWLFLSPLVKLIATLILTHSIYGFFTAMNKRFKTDVYTESDMFLFGIAGAIVLCGIQIMLHIQKINGLNMTANLVFTILNNLSYILYFLAIYWVKTYKTNTAMLESSIKKYIITSNVERKVLGTPWLMLAVSYMVSLMLSIPNFIGLQWLRNDLSLVITSILVMAVVYLILRKFFAHCWNYLATILFDTNRDLPLLATPYNIRINKRTTQIVGGISALLLLLFTVFKAKYMFMFLLTTLFIAAVIFAAVVLGYFIPLLIGSVISSIRNNDSLYMPFSRITNYFKTVSISFGKSSALAFGIILFTFITITVFPKKLDCIRIYKNNSCVIDTNGDVLWLDDEHDFYYVPLEYNEIPDFVKKCITTQEDRGFFRQNSWFPNKSNWHGISLASFFAGRGGSNINSQVIKNLTYIDASGFPRDLARKTTDQIGGYMLSLTETPEQIMTDYINVACFHGGRGYRGLNAASLFAFGKPVGSLNQLEQMYLVRTLPHSGYQVDSSKAKSETIDMAKQWKNRGLIKKSEYNEMNSCDIHFVNRPYNSDISTGTRSYIKKHFKSAERHNTYISLQNENALLKAYNKLKSSKVYYKNGSELQVAAMVIDVKTGHVIGHYSSGLVDYNDFGQGFPIGSLGKPAIILEMLRKVASQNLTLFDGKVGKRKTPANATHPWKNKQVSIKTILSQSLNAPFVNICDVMSPKPVFESVESAYESIGIMPHKDLCSDTYNYPLGNRHMTVFDIAQLYQTIFNDGIRIKLQAECLYDTANFTKRIWVTNSINVIKDALSETIKTGTMQEHRNKLPKYKTFYSKTGTSSGKSNWRGGKDGWCVLSDGETLIVCWASYGKRNGKQITLGTEPLFGSSTAGLFAVFIYNELLKTSKV